MGVLGRIWRTTQSWWQLTSYRHVRPKHVLRWRPAGNYQSYMIRFWRTNSSVPWRAAVVDPHDDVIRYFANREALYAFLDAQIDALTSQASQT